MNEQQERANRIVKEFDAQGWHRTGTEVDRRSAEWLAEWVRNCGAEPVLEPFALSRVVPRSCYVEIGGRRIDGLPLFDGGFTDRAGVAGRLGPIGSESDVGLTEATANAATTGPLGDARRAGRHRAIVTVSRGALPGLAPSNAWFFTAPFGPPVLQVGSEEGAYLAAAVNRGAEVRVVASVDREPTEALNVVARVPGTEPTLTPLVVMTPRSGWWECASERGGGIVCWLEMIQAMTAAPVERDVVFVASSGHELGHIGLEAFMGQRRDLATTALAWFHFGANIGAANGRGRLLASDDELERLTLGALAEEGLTGLIAAPRGVAPAGEAHNIHVRDGRYASLVGSSELFHLQADRWPEAVDVPAIARYATAFTRLIADLARTPVAV